MAVDWSQLPTELLQLISEKLNSEFYLLRFRSVCSTWRSSIPNNRPNHHLPFKLPPIHSFPENDNIFYLVKHTIFLIKPATITISHQHQQTLQPRLIRIGPNVNGKTHLWHPLDLTKHLPFNFPHNVLDFNQLSIVDLGHVFLLYMLKATDSLQNHPFPSVYYHKVAAATYPGELQPHIITLDNCHRPRMFRSWDYGWMQIPKDFECGDICNFKGRTCVVDNEGETVMVGPDLSVDFVTGLGSCNARLCLVESDLLLVDTIYVKCDVWIDVYRLDEKQKKWVKLSNIGDRVLFLGNQCSFSVSASDLGFANGNCVIILDDSPPDCGMSVLNFDEARVLPLSDYPNYFNLLATSGVDRKQLHWE